MAPGLEESELAAKLSEASEILLEVFDITDALYQKHELSTIP